MLIERIMGAFTFRKGVYAEAARDAGFTSGAWLIVVATAFLSQLGASSSYLRNGHGLGGYIVAVMVGLALGVLGFTLSAFLISWLGRELFKASASFEELVRAMGLANVWRVIGFIGILAAITPVLSCVLTPVTVLAGLAGLVAYLFSIREATGMDWVGVIVTVVVALLVQLLVTAIATGFLAVLGLGAAALL
jgi:hypothetical protein